MVTPPQVFSLSWVSSSRWIGGEADHVRQEEAQGQRQEGLLTATLLAVGVLALIGFALLLGGAEANGRGDSGYDYGRHGGDIASPGSDE